MSLMHDQPGCSKEVNNQTFRLSHYIYVISNTLVPYDNFFSELTRNFLILQFFREVWYLYWWTKTNYTATLAFYADCYHLKLRARVRRFVDIISSLNFTAPVRYY